MKKIDLTNILLLLSLAAIWGASYLFMRIAGPVLLPVVLISLRVILAAITLLTYSALKRDLPNFRHHWTDFLVMGILNNVIPFLLIVSAVIDLNASIAAMLNATMPLFTATVAALFGLEVFNARKALGVVMGLFGVAVLVGLSPLPVTSTVILASIKALVAALSYGFAAVFARARFKGIKPLHSAVGQLTGSSLVMAPLLLFSLPHEATTPLVWASIIGLAVICTAVAYLLYFRLIARAGATQTSTVTFLIPFFSVLWGVTLLGEPINLGMFLGLCIILASVWLVMGVREPVSRSLGQGP